MSIRRTDSGVAIIAAVMATTLLLALGSALILATSSETSIAANFRSAATARYAADAMLERTVDELSALPNWTFTPGGTSVAAFVDGPSSGTRLLADGVVLDLNEIVNIANCHKPAGCTAADLDAITGGRPWGARNPRWRLYAHGYLSGLLSNPATDTCCYVVALVSDDPSDNDGDPLVDGVETASQPNPGRGVLAIRVEAFGMRRSHVIVEATIARNDIPGSTASSMPPAVWRVAEREIH